MSKTPLVTGASKGIGLETVRRFVSHSSDVTKIIMFARESDDFTENLKALRSDNPRGVELVPYAIDLTDHAAILELIPRIAADYRTINYLVNNAGYTKPVPIPQVDFADFERTIGVNLYAPCTIIHELLHRADQFELIVNIASTAGINGRSGWLTYSASTAAVINMSEVLREELAIYGTRVVCISPGRTATALRKVLAPTEDPSTIMQPQDVDEVIEMLASPVGKFVDSANLVVRQ